MAERGGYRTGDSLRGCGLRANTRQARAAGPPKPRLRRAGDGECYDARFPQAPQGPQELEWRRTNGPSGGTPGDSAARPCDARNEEHADPEGLRQPASHKAASDLGLRGSRSCTCVGAAGSILSTAKTAGWGPTRGSEGVFLKILASNPTHKFLDVFGL